MKPQLFNPSEPQIQAIQLLFADGYSMLARLPDAAEPSIMVLYHPLKGEMRFISENGTIYTACAMKRLFAERKLKLQSLRPCKEQLN